MNAVGIDPERLANALRMHAEGSTVDMAAVELLISHGHWLRREPFLTRVVFWTAEQTSGDETAVPDWDALTVMATERDGLFDTSSEIGVLRVACCIATGWLGDALTSCDRVNVLLIAQAVARAGGVR